MSGRPKVVFVYADRVAREMGGVGIRALELARALAGEAEVSIAASETDGTNLGVPVSTFDPHAPRALSRVVQGAQLVVAQPQWPLAMRAMAHSGAQLVFDLYDPEVFGTYEHFAGRKPAIRGAMASFAADRVVQALRLGDRIICGSERQRDLWLGAMLSAGRLEGGAYAHDPSLRSLIDVVPFGLPQDGPRRGPSPGPRELLGIGSDEELVLWNGGIWSWLDAPAAIRAIARLRERRPSARLVFMGASPAGPARQATEEARALADELGLLGSGVLFHQEWVPYAERGGWLLEADCAVSAHLDDLEAHFAHRTRLLDCFWARLPVVCTTGDELAEVVEREGLGGTAPPGDYEALAAALEGVLDLGRDHFGEPLGRVAAEYTWSRAAAPLRRWLHESPPPRPRPGGRTPGERARTATYVAGASTAAALRLPLPRMS